MTKGEFERSLVASAELFAAEDLGGSADALRACLQYNAEDVHVWNNLGYVLYLQGELTGAEQAFKRAMELAPNFVEAHSNLALVVMAQRQYGAAEKILLSGLELSPEFVDLWINLGLTRLQCNQIPAAIAALHQAVTLEPNSAPALTNLGLCLQEIGQIEKAHQIYALALSVRPDYRPAISNFLMCAQYHPGLNSQQLRDDAQSSVAGVRAEKTLLPVRRSSGDCQTLTLGFISGDFRAHPVGWFLKPVFRELRKHFDCYCYMNQRGDEDEVTAEFRTLASGWRVIIGKNTEQVCDLIRADGIDVLIDLAGHTAANRIDVFAARAAHTQLSWLGYPATTGLATYDGVILSRDLATDATQSFFSEPILVIDAPQFVYAPPDYLPDTSPLPFDKNGYITFGCFNNVAKLNDSVLVCWAELMKQAPQARLVLKWRTLADQTVCDVLRRRLHSLGVDLSRVELRGASPHNQMLAEYGDIDIALDPFPFSGALTTFESAWMGVPVITLISERPISRQTYSVNKTLGLKELTAETPQEYVMAALNLAQDIDKLRVLRQSLKQKIEASALVDSNSMAIEITKKIKSVIAG